MSAIVLKQLFIQILKPVLIFQEASICIQYQLHIRKKELLHVTKGLIGLNESVTWQAVHFGIKQKLTSKITMFDRPYHFRDEMIKGAFKSIQHDHYFEMKNDHVSMKDIFQFQSPLGILGELADKLVLTNYLKQLLQKRNNIIKMYAESGKAKALLNQ